MAEIKAESPESRNEAIIFKLSFVLLTSAQTQHTWGHFKYIKKQFIFILLRKVLWKTLKYNFVLHSKTRN